MPPHTRGHRLALRVGRASAAASLLQGTGAAPPGSFSRPLREKPAPEPQREPSRQRANSIGLWALLGTSRGHGALPCVRLSGAAPGSQRVCGSRVRRAQRL